MFHRMAGAGMTHLVPGGNAPVISGPLRVEIRYTPVSGVDMDVSAFILNSAGKVRGDGDMCFYGQPRVLAGAVQMTEAIAGRAVLDLDLSRLDPCIEKIALTATLYENKARFEQVSQLSLTVSGDLEALIPTTGMQETALILGEFYRRQGGWKFRCVAQGFAGGLEPLAQYFGVEVAAPPSPQVAPEPVPVIPPTPKPAISLSKVTLDKTRATISLEKTPAGFGEIKVNLNWNQGKTGGFFARSKSIDLDVGCLFELQNGRKGVIQALGKSFGALNSPPYIQLMGDDRTGAVAGGEWLHINGNHWSELRRLLIFAFIYKGVPNWRATDGVVTLHIPHQPDIEVRMNEEGGSLGLCAIALLENDQGAVKVSRRVDFHRDQEVMDHAYHWGLRWAAGSK